MFVHHLCSWCSERPEEDVESPELQMSVNLPVGARTEFSLLGLLSGAERAFIC